MHEHEHGQEHGHGMVNPVQLQKFLGGINYPIDKRALLDRARDAGADSDVLDALQRLPDQRYNSPTDISEQIGKLT
ncbi:DUF2795 domain-containing protein [Sphaerobacter sp.]|mgnify:FL=1|uniref:DUF2795 domain-containing protein n=1 Tax=Sphaerobacter sp. TaxID=2099654 RepID=UPI001D6D2888|nr:DUF2795 domain-containing protein [Sphaerobacter sp.]MBX5446246.1 DUF2795 domain-containing protein [Sphaerobacter sp.]